MNVPTWPLCAVPLSGRGIEGKELTYTRPPARVVEDSWIQIGESMFITCSGCGDAYDVDSFVEMNRHVENCLGVKTEMRLRRDPTTCPHCEEYMPPVSPRLRETSWDTTHRAFQEHLSACNASNADEVRRLLAVNE